jgi:mannose-6-phosphate isomerase-like protein (cupin superfamily)
VSTPVAPFAVQSGKGAALETPTGDVVTVKAATRQTNGSLTVLELVIGPKKGPALHTHLREDELWYVIDGDFRFKAGGAMLRVSTGGLAFGPRGTPHAFQNIGETPGRLLVITTPSGLERFFEEFAVLLPGPAGPEALAAVGRASWVEFHGPPVAVSDPLSGGL